MATAMLGNRGPDWSRIAGFTIAIFVVDRAARPFAKMRYDDLIDYLKRVSRDGEVHSIDSRTPFQIGGAL